MTTQVWKNWNFKIMTITIIIYVIVLMNFRRIFAGFGQKACLPDGSWFKHPDSNKTWSNYTTCVDLDDLKVGVVKNISVFNFSGGR